ncbi:MAG: hypothetical protein JOZ47_08845 [Kutzneria sp.]|nr:hypothetical protein [Kutzneria sp.]
MSGNRRIVLENAAHRLLVAGFLVLSAARKADSLGDDAAAVILTEQASVLVERAAQVRALASRRFIRLPRRRAWNRARARWGTI